MTVVASAPASESPSARTRPPGVIPNRPGSPAAAGAPKFAVQVAALSDPHRARSVVRDLSAAGYNAYVVSPSADNPGAPYRIRIGGYPSREAASSAAARLGRLRGEKLWVIPE